MTENFYRAFEDRHRGSRELISSRQQIYLPFVTPLLTLNNDCRAVDLGCGRGEWLEILVGRGFKAQGIDLDNGMLEACRERDLPAFQSDAVTFLKSLEDSSQAVVSGFHIAEHVPFPYLQTMVAEALRVLVPGGILILETPNAENLMVGTNNFYLDPTHEKPVPHQLLSFLVEYTGFQRSKLLRLQEPSQLHDESHPIDLMAVFSAVSPDYAIVAQKSADEHTMAQFDEAYGQVHGLSLDTLAARYDNARAAKLDTRILELESKNDNKLRLLEKQIEEKLETKLQQLIEHERALARQQALAQEQLLASVLNSTSWKITKPMRSGVEFSIRVLRFGKRKSKDALKVSIRRLLGFVMVRPRLRARLSRVVKMMPGLHERLSLFEAATKAHANGRAMGPTNDGQQPVSRRAQFIYNALEKSTESRITD